MLDEVKSVQNKAIYEIINEISIKDEIVFKAPTGAGKTFIMARFMDELLHSDDSIVFIVSSLSKAGLAQQNYDKFCEYLDLGLINDIKPYLISSESSGENSIYIPSHENVYVLPITASFSFLIFIINCSPVASLKITGLRTVVGFLPPVSSV